MHQVYTEEYSTDTRLRNAELAPDSTSAPSDRLPGLGRHCKKPIAGQDLSGTRIFGVDKPIPVFF